MPDTIIRDTLLILLALAGVVAGTRALQPQRAQKWLPPATPEALGATRIWIALILLAQVLWEDLPSSAYLPRSLLNLENHKLVGLLAHVPGFTDMLADPAALQVFSLITIVLLAAAAAGLVTRVSVPAGAIAYMIFAAILRSYAWSYHMGVVPLYALMLLAFTPCGDALSLDRWLRVRRGLPVAPAHVPQLTYSISRFMIWMGVALPYTLAGLSKLRNTGLAWPQQMKQMLVGTILEPMHFDFKLTYLLLRGPDWVFDALGVLALITEITFVLVLVHPLARKVLPAIMAMIHVGILLTQNILFPDLIAVQAIFYNWALPFRRLKAAAEEPVDQVRHGQRLVPRQLYAAHAVLWLMFLVWATRTERFPLSAMQMFSRPVSAQPIQYVRPFVRYDDGTTEPARFERWIGALKDTRYRRVLSRAVDSPRHQATLGELLQATGQRANAVAGDGRRVTHFDLEVRRWDFRQHPTDPARGSVLAVLRYDLAAQDFTQLQPSQVSQAQASRNR